MAETVRDGDVRGLSLWAVRVQREHVETVRRAALALAVEEAKEQVA